MPDPDLGLLQMEEEARQHFCEAEMERRDIGTGNALADQSQSPNTCADSTTSNEDDAHR